MSISEQIEVMISSLTGNNHPPQVVTILKSFNNNTVDIRLKDGTVNKSIRASGVCDSGTEGLLTFEDGDSNKPFVVLFENENTPSGDLSAYVKKSDVRLKFEVSSPSPLDDSNGGYMTIGIDVGDGF